MTALQLIIINIIILGGASWLVYAMTHGGKNTKKNKLILVFKFLYQLLSNLYITQYNT